MVPNPFPVLCGNMALLLNDAYIQYYHMDVIRPIPLGCISLESLEYLAIRMWMPIMIQHSDIALLT